VEFVIPPPPINNPRTALVWDFFCALTQFNPLAEIETHLFGIYLAFMKSNKEIQHKKDHQPKRAGGLVCWWCGG